MDPNINDVAEVAAEWDRLVSAREGDCDDYVRLCLLMADRWNRMSPAEQSAVDDLAEAINATASPGEI